MHTRAPYRKEAYRLWFEYLRLARSSSDAKVRKALQRSAKYYEPWGNLQNVNFDRWWKENGRLFEEQFSVRRLSSGENPADPTALIIEVPLTQPKSKLFAQVRNIIRDAYPSQTPRKAHFRPVTQYRLTVGAEPRTTALREMLNVYRVYLENERLRGQDLLKKVHAFYLGRKRKRNIPGHLTYGTYGDSIVAQRNVRRYIQKAKRITLNVAKGEFPGRYE
jgi:hypothetical protein